MEFKDRLNDYMVTLGCSAKTLAEASELSPTVLSRYRNGERQPAADSKQLQKLCNGIGLLAEQKGNAELSTDRVKAAFQEILSSRKTNPRILSTNLKALIAALEINKAELSRFLNYDPSYLSRICSGQRTPANIDKFIIDVCRFVVRRFSREADRQVVSSLLDCPVEDLSDDFLYQEKLAAWFGTQNELPEKKNFIGRFLDEINSFSLEEYRRAIEKTAPPEAFLGNPIITANKRGDAFYTYFGLENIHLGELDFFRLSLESPHKTPLFLATDIPMPAVLDQDPGDTSSNPGLFEKNWGYYLSHIVERNIPIDIIHNLNQSLNDLVYQLKLWLPVYMTGNLHSYYLKEGQSSVYSSLTYASGGAAMQGEYIHGSSDIGRATLITRPEDVAYYQRKAECLRHLAQPLIEIYRDKDLESFSAFMEADARTSGNRREVVSSPPFFTMDEELMRQILTRASLKAEEIEGIVAGGRACRERINTILSHGRLDVEYSRLTEKQFAKSPPFLDLDGLFVDRAIAYTYPEYLRHVELTRAFQAEHHNFTLKETSQQKFPNISLLTHENKWTAVIKRRDPSIVFVIRYPKLRAALERVAVPVVSQK